MPQTKFFLGSILLAALLITLPACKKNYERIKPTIESITESVYASGSIKSENQYQVFPTVNGLIKKIMVKEGDVVENGAELIVIENQAVELNTENARLAAELAEWNTQGARLTELERAIETARAKLLNDSLLYVRQEGLWAH